MIDGTGNQTCFLPGCVYHLLSLWQQDTQHTWDFALDLRGGLEGPETELTALTFRFTEPLFTALLKRSLAYYVCVSLCVSKTYSFWLSRITCALLTLTSSILFPACCCLYLFCCSDEAGRVQTSS